MIAAAVEKGATEVEEHVESVVVFSFEQPAYAVSGEETVEAVGVFGRKEVGVETGGGGLLLNGGGDGVGVIEDGDAYRKEKTLGIERAITAEEGF